MVRISDTGDPEIQPTRWWEYEDANVARQKAREKFAQMRSVLDPYIGQNDFAGAREAIANADRPAGEDSMDSGLASRVKNSLSDKWAQPQADPELQQGRWWDQPRDTGITIEPNKVADFGPSKPQKTTFAERNAVADKFAGQTMGPPTADIQPLSADEQQAMQRNAESPTGRAAAAHMLTGDPVKDAETIRLIKQGDTHWGPEDLLSGEKTLAHFGVDSSELPGPLRTAVDVGLAPANLAGVGFGGLGGKTALEVGGILAKRWAAQTVGGIAAQKAGEATDAGLQAYGESGLPGADVAAHPVTRTVAGLAVPALAGVGGYMAAEKALDAAPGAIKGAHDQAIALDQRINEPVQPGTGQPVSAGMAQSGTPFDTPEIIKARQAQSAIPSTSLLADSTPSTFPTGSHLIPRELQGQTMPRAEMRQAIADAMPVGIERGPEGRLMEVTGQAARQLPLKAEYRADLVLGPPAAGKSSVIVRPVAYEHGSLVLDADVAKEMLPEFSGGANAGAVHLESAQIFSEALSNAARSGQNIVLPIVGKGEASVRGYIDQLRAAGYDVHLHLMDLAPEEAAKRAITRFNETGRFVDPHYVLNEVGSRPRSVYDKLKGGSEIASYEAYSNDVPFGQPAKLIEHSSGTPGAPSGYGPGGSAGSGISAGDAASPAGPRAGTAAAGLDQPAATSLAAEASQPVVPEYTQPNGKVEPPVPPPPGPPTVHSAPTPNQPERIVPELGYGGVNQAIRSKAEAYQAPGVITRHLPPPLLKLWGTVDTAVTMPKDIVVAWRARGGTRAKLNTLWHSQMQPYVDGIEEAMTNHPATYIGPRGTAADAIIGTFKDIAENPELYTIPAPLRAALDAYDKARWDFVSGAARAGYGVDVMPFTAGGKEGYVFTPNIATKASVEEKIANAFPGVETGQVEQAAQRMSLTRGTKERFYNTARERMAHDPTFQPVTDIRELNTVHIQGMAQNAADNVFKTGAGGLTRGELMEQLHPGLVAERQRTEQLVNSLEGRLATAEGRVKDYTANAEQAATRLNQQASRYSNLAERAANRKASWQERLAAAREMGAAARVDLTETRQALQQALKEQGAAGVTNRAAKSKMTGLLKRIDNLSQKYATAMDAAEATQGEAVQRTVALMDSKAATPLWKEALALQKEANAYVRKVGAVPVGPAAVKAEAAAAEREAANAAAREAKKSFSASEREAINAARREGRNAQDVVLGRLEGRMSEMENRIKDLGRTAAQHGDAADRLNPLVDGLKQSLDDVKAQKAQLDKAYRTADTGGYAYDGATYRYYPPDAAKAINYLTAQASGPLKTLTDIGDEIRAWHFAGDGSPLTVQDQLAFLASPLNTAKAIKEWVSAWGQGGPIEALSRIARTEADDVAQYTFHTGRQFGKQEAELSAITGGGTKGLARIPKLKLGELEDKLFASVQLSQYRMWQADRDMLIKRGMSPNLAAAEAANFTSKLVPSLSTSERAVSGSRAAVERTVLTSVSFAAAPALVMKDFTSGMVKLAASNAAHPGAGWAALTGREQIAIKRVLLAGTGVSAVSGISAMAWANSRGLDPMEALKQNFDPNSRYFLSLQLGGGKSIPLGGTYRSAIKALYPDRNGVYFGNLGGWLESKANTPIALPRDLIRNADFYGNEIYKGNLLKPENVLRTLWYGVESAAPMVPGEVMKDVRTRDLDPNNTLSGVGSQFMGVNYTPVSANEKLNQLARSTEYTDSKGVVHSGTGNFFDLPPSVQDTVKKQNPELWAQSVAQGSDQRKAAETQRKTAATEQQGDDESLLSGELSVKQWNDAAGARRDQLTGALKAIYADSNYQSDSADRKVLDGYYKAIDDAKKNGRVDWAKVDAYVAGLPQSEQDYINANTGTNLTPLQSLRKDLLNEYMSVRKYPGMDAAMANRVDQAVAMVRGTGRPDVQQVRMLNDLASRGVLDPQVAGYARRVVLGIVEATADRQRWADRHPASAIFKAQGALDARQIAAIEAELAKRGK